MKNRIVKTLAIAVLMLICTVTSFAQLKVSLNVNAHPDPYLSNWPNIKNTVIVTVTNSGKTAVPVKFDCKVNLNSVLQANTKPESMRTLQIASGVTQFYAEDLVPFEAVKVLGGADRTAVKTGMLPAGDYEFCVSLIDPTTNAQLTAPVCKNFTLASYQAPILEQPEDKSVLGKNKRPTFRWSALSPKYPSVVSYRVVVMEVLEGQNAVTAFRANRPILDRTVATTQLLWPADIEQPNENMQYVWGVQTLDDKGNAIVKEANGWSEPFTFGRRPGLRIVGGGDDDHDGGGKPRKRKPHKMAEVVSGNLNGISLLQPGNGAELEFTQPLIFTWTPLAKATAYTLRIVELRQDESPERAINSSKPLYEGKDIPGTSMQYHIALNKAEAKAGGKMIAWMVSSGDVKSEIHTVKITPLEKNRITLISPKNNEPIKDKNNIEFEWRGPKSKEGFSLVIFEIDTKQYNEITKNKDARVKIGKPLFEKNGIQENHLTLRDPSIKFQKDLHYGWAVRWGGVTNLGIAFLYPSYFPMYALQPFNIVEDECIQELYWYDGEPGSLDGGLFISFLPSDGQVSHQYKIAKVPSGNYIPDGHGSWEIDPLYPYLNALNRNDAINGTPDYSGYINPSTGAQEGWTNPIYVGTATNDPNDYAYLDLPVGTPNFDIPHSYHWHPYYNSNTGNYGVNIFEMDYWYILWIGCTDDNSTGKTYLISPYSPTQY